MSNPCQRHAAFLLFFLVSLSVCGCSSKPSRMAVQGIVLYQGEPLKDGTIQFEPQDIPDGVGGGAVVSNGVYSISAEQGLYPGKYRVQISAADSKAPTPGPNALPGTVFEKAEKLPARYNKESTLDAEIKPSGPNKVDFMLD